MPAWTGAAAGIYGCGLSLSSVLLLKPETANRGVVGSSILDFGLPSFVLIPCYEIKHF